MTQLFQIGGLARECSVAIETIRYYEREGLLPRPNRTASNYRVYGHKHVERLAFIAHCRVLDMTHDEIRTLLSLRDNPSADCGDVNALLDEHIGHVTHRIDELERLKLQLRKLRRQCAKAQTTKNCGILRELERSTEPKLRSGSGHVHRVHGRNAGRLK